MQRKEIMKMNDKDNFLVFELHEWYLNNIKNDTLQSKQTKESFCINKSSYEVPWLENFVETLEFQNFL